MDHMKEVDELKETCSTLMTWMKTGICQGMEACNASELGEVADMIKDLSDAKKNCLEAKYYETVIEAMEESGEESRYGYNTNRSMNGRFASKGRGMTIGKMGYKPYMDQEPYIDAYIHDPNFKENMRFGYTDWKPMIGDERYGRAYNDYKEAKRHYTETKSQTDKDNMHLHATEHLNDTLTTLRDIWSGADPELKKRMRSDLMNLTAEMTV